MTRPVPPSLHDAITLLADMNAAMATLKGRRKETAARRRDWQALKKENTPAVVGLPSGVMFENMLMGLLVEGLLGLPVFSGLDLADETVRGLGFLGTALHHDAAEKDGHPIRDDAPVLESFLSMAVLDGQKARLDNTDAAHKMQMAELAQLKKMMLMLMAAVAAQNRARDADRNADLVPDVLRHPKIARFKQNRHSMTCIKTMFQRQSNMMAPVARAA
jgi:hypothetical protein